MNGRDKLTELIEQAEGLKNNDFPSVEEIADHILADGWIRMPCKVGQIVWLIRDSRSKIEETTVEKIVLKDGGLYLKLLCNSFYETTCRSIGKTVFFTKEEAERALKEREQGGC